MKTLTRDGGVETADNGALELQAPMVWLIDSFCFTPWYTSELAQTLESGGAKVRLVCGEFTREPEYFGKLGLQPVPGPVRVSHFLKDGPTALRRAVRIAEVMFNTRALMHELHDRRGARPSIIHLQQLPLLNYGLRSDFSLIDAAQQAGIPVVHTVHNFLPHDSGERLRTTYAELYNRVDHLICHSPAILTRLVKEFGIPERRVSVIPHGPLFAPKYPLTEQGGLVARERLGLPVKSLVVLWQGVLAQYKGLDILLDAWKLCMRRWDLQKGPLPLLLIAGSGSAKLEEEVRQAAAATPDTVRADLGYISTDRLPLYYEAADILVYPYRSITTSGALLTGLSYGKPIIASRLAAFEEYLTDRGNALLVEPADATALAATLFNLLQELSRTRPFTGATDAGNLYTQLAAEAKQNKGRCTAWKEIGERTVTLYRDLLREKVPLQSI